MRVALRTEKLTKRFGSLAAVDGLDLEVREGEVFGFLGPNGAGKTTTLRLLCALIGATSDTAEVAGFRLGRQDSEIRAAVGILTEQPGMYERQSAWDNLVFFATLYGLNKATAHAQTERFLRLMGLWELRDEAVATFSRGMKQKMAISRSALHEPRILFLDEPTTGLDPDAAKTVREFIVALRAEGRTVFLCTHNLDEADRLCDRIAFFSHHVIRIDTPDQLRAELYGRATEFRLVPHPRPEDLARVRAIPGVRDARLEIGARPDRPTLVRAVCVREWREALGNKLLVGMTLLPPVIILAAGIVAVAAAAVNPPSDRDVQALYASAPAVAGLDPKDAVQGFIATYFLILFMLIPTVVPLTMAIYSVIGEKASRTLEPLLATPVGVGDLLFAKSLASTVPSVIVTWAAYGIYLATVISLGSRAAVRAVTAPRWVLAIVVMVPLLTMLSVNLGILISTRVNDVRVAQQIGGLVVVPVVGLGIAQVTGRVVLDNGAFLEMTIILMVLDLAVFWLARLAFQRENILVRWR